MFELREVGVGASRWVDGLNFEFEVAAREESGVAFFAQPDIDSDFGG